MVEVYSYVLFVASMVISLVNMEGEETFDASLLGSAESVTQERICDDELIIIRGYEIMCARYCTCTFCIAAS